MPTSNESVGIRHYADQHPIELRDEEQRTVYGRIIPYGETITVRGRPESFQQGALADIDPTTIRLLAHHDTTQPIGRSIGLEERADGAYATFRISRTRLGDEMLELARDGVLGFSVGFIPGVQSRAGVHQRLKALPETSLVTFAAYPSAQILAVREQEKDMPATGETHQTDHTATDSNNTITHVNTRTATDSPDLGALEVRVGELADTVTRLGSIVDAPTPHRHIGGPTPIDWFRAQLDVAAGRHERRHRLEEEWAAFVTRDLADITGTLAGTGDISGAVVEEYIASQLVNVLDARRRLFSRLGSFPMPRSGYAQIPVVTQHTTVAVRAGQKEPANSRAMKIVTQPFAAVWYDGAVDVSLEIIRTAELPVIEMVWSDLLAQYAIATEAGVVGMIEAGGHGFRYTGTALKTDTYKNLMTDVATEAITVEGNSGSPATHLAVTKAQWIAIVAMADQEGRRYFAPIGPTNADATAAITSQALTITGGIEVFYVPGLTQAVMFNQQALRAADGGIERVTATNVELMGQDLGVLGRTMFVPRIPAGVSIFGTDPES